MEKQELARLFSGFDKAEPVAGSGGTPKVNANGHYLVEVGEVKLKQSEKYAGTYFIVEFKVVASDTDRIGEGNVYSWSHDITNRHYGMANTKNFIASVLGFDPESAEAAAVNTDDLFEALSHEQPLRGLRVNLKVNHKTTEGGRDFWIHSWTPDRSHSSDE